jgi:hypothetical protein
VLGFKTELGRRGFRAPARIAQMLIIAGMLATAPIAVAQTLPNQVVENPQSYLDMRRFGAALAVDGDTMMIGAPDSVVNDVSDVGFVQVLERSATLGWVPVANLIAPNDSDSGEFGTSIVIRGDTAVIGARVDSDAVPSGALYVYTRTAGVWSFSQRLAASDPENFTSFGCSVDMDGDTIVVGAFTDPDTQSGTPLSGAGSAYIFTSSGGTWTQQQKLVAADRDVQDRFGNSVRISGDTVVIGCHQDDAVGAANAGSAYVFKRTAGNWALEQKLLPPLGTIANDNFGWSVAIEGDTIFVGAYRMDRESFDEGGVFCFTRSGGTWIYLQEVRQPVPVFGDFFGTALSLEGDVLFATATGDNSLTGTIFRSERSGGVWGAMESIDIEQPLYPGEIGHFLAHSGPYAVTSMGISGDEGYAVILEEDAGIWKRVDIVYSSDRSLSDFFGAATAASTNTLVVGVSGDDLLQSSSGSAYIYTLEGGTWQESQWLHPVLGVHTSGFGSAVTISGDLMAIASLSDTIDGVSDAGSVYLYERTNSYWGLDTRLTPPTPILGENFGISVSLEGNRLAVGTSSIFVSPPDSPGFVFIYDKVGGVWSLTETLTAPASAIGDRFGTSVALRGQKLVVGAPNYGTTASGLAYVYRHDGAGNWDLEGTLTTPSGTLGDGFGRSVAFGPNRILIGAPSTPIGAALPGRVHAFDFDSGAWSHKMSFVSPITTVGDGFGFALSLVADRALIGAPNALSSPGTNSGTAYLWAWDAGVWTEETLLSQDSPIALDAFGGSVALTPTHMFVGASGHDLVDVNAGTAYVFNRGGSTSAVNDAWSMYE